MLGSQYNYICIVFYEHFVHFCRNFTGLNILFVRKHGVMGRIKVTLIYIELHCQHNLIYISFAYQVQKSVDSQFKKAIEQYRDNIDLQNAIDSVQESVSYEAKLSY